MRIPYILCQHSDGSCKAAIHVVVPDFAGRDQLAPMSSSLNRKSKLSASTFSSSPLFAEQVVAKPVEPARDTLGALVQNCQRIKLVVQKNKRHIPQVTNSPADHLDA